jgi:hypothetical protein
MASQLRLLIFAALGAASPGLVGCGLGGTKSQPDDEDGDLWRVPFDCDDHDAGVHPGATERCDGVDNDCDGAVDSFLWGQDLDGDGFSAPSPWSVCDDPPPAVPYDGDCDDAEPLIFPGAGEVCGDGVDSDCNGNVSCLAMSFVTGARSCDYVWSLDEIEAVHSPCEGCSFDFYPIRPALQPASNIADCDPEFLPALWFYFEGDQLYYFDEPAVLLTSSSGGWVDGIFGFDRTFDDGFSPGALSERWFGEFKLDEIQYDYDDGYDGGRPFTVGGVARLARIDAQGDAWSDAAVAVAGPPPMHLQQHIAGRWAQLGRMEHASVGSFARFSLELLALGAPPALLTEAAAAMADEVRHARSCFGLAEALGGGPVRPGALDLSGSLAHLDRSVDIHAIFTALLTEACVVETVAAAQAERALAAAVDPAVRAVLATIVADEARHAAYGWRCARWMLGAHPELRGLVRPLLARLAPADQPLPPADPHADILAHFGLLDRRAQAQAARDAHQKVIQPAAALLLREGPDFA